MGRLITSFSDVLGRPKMVWSDAIEKVYSLNWLKMLLPDYKLAD